MSLAWPLAEFGAEPADGCPGSLDGWELMAIEGGHHGPSGVQEAILGYWAVQKNVHVHVHVQCLYAYMYTYVYTHMYMYMCVRTVVVWACIIMYMTIHVLVIFRGHNL